jgi:AcrR family transcriptional regulator
MSDVAREVNYDRRTLYRYFANKDELVLEVVVHILKEWNAYQQAVHRSLTGTGLEKFTGFYQTIMEKQSRIDLIVLVTEFDMVFDLDEFLSKIDKTDLVDRYYQEAVLPHSIVREILTEGIQDGSIRELDVEAIIPVFHNVLWSITQKASFSKRSINEVLKIDFLDIIKKQLNIYVEYLRG